MYEIANKLVQGNISAIMIVGITGMLYLIKIAIPTLIAKNLEVMKNENNKTIEKLKSELDKQKQQLEHIHQVSQVTYQNLFEKKINIYQNLIEIKSQYPIQTIIQKKEKNIPEEDYEDFIRAYINALDKIINIIETNTLFISKDLLEMYQELNKKYSRFDNESFELLRNIETSQNENDYLQYEIIEKNILYEKMYEETNPELKNIIRILDNDTSKIKAKINFD